MAPRRQCAREVWGVGTPARHGGTGGEEDGSSAAHSLCSPGLLQLAATPASVPGSTGGGGDLALELFATPCGETCGEASPRSREAVERLQAALEELRAASSARDEASAARRSAVAEAAAEQAERAGRAEESEEEAAAAEAAERRGEPLPLDLEGLRQEVAWLNAAEVQQQRTSELLSLLLGGEALRLAQQSCAALAGDAPERLRELERLSTAAAEGAEHGREQALALEAALAEARGELEEEAARTADTAKREAGAQQRAVQESQAFCRAAESRHRKSVELKSTKRELKHLRLELERAQSSSSRPQEAHGAEPDEVGRLQREVQQLRSELSAAGGAAGNGGPGMSQVAVVRAAPPSAVACQDVAERLREHAGVGTVAGLLQMLFGNTERALEPCDLQVFSEETLISLALRCDGETWQPLESTSPARPPSAAAPRTEEVQLDDGEEAAEDSATLDKTMEWLMNADDDPQDLILAGRADVLEDSEEEEDLEWVTSDTGSAECRAAAVELFEPVAVEVLIDTGALPRPEAVPVEEPREADAASPAGADAQVATAGEAGRGAPQGGTAPAQDDPAAGGAPPPRPSLDRGTSSGEEVIDLDEAQGAAPPPPQGFSKLRRDAGSPCLTSSSENNAEAFEAATFLGAAGDAAAAGGLVGAAVVAEDGANGEAEAEDEDEDDGAGSSSSSSSDILDPGVVAQLEAEAEAAVEASRSGCGQQPAGPVTSLREAEEEVRPEEEQEDEEPARPAEQQAAAEAPAPLADAGRAEVLEGAPPTGSSGPGAEASATPGAEVASAGEPREAAPEDARAQPESDSKAKAEEAERVDAEKKPEDREEAAVRPAQLSEDTSRGEKEEVKPAPPSADEVVRPAPLKADEGDPREEKDEVKPAPPSVEEVVRPAPLSTEDARGEKEEIKPAPLNADEVVRPAPLDQEEVKAAPLNAGEVVGPVPLSTEEARGEKEDVKPAPPNVEEVVRPMALNNDEGGAREAKEEVKAAPLSADEAVRPVPVNTDKADAREAKEEVKPAPLNADEVVRPAPLNKDEAQEEREGVTPAPLSADEERKEQEAVKPPPLNKEEERGGEDEVKPASLRDGLDELDTKSQAHEASDGSTRAEDEGTPGGIGDRPEAVEAAGDEQVPAAATPAPGAGNPDAGAPLAHGAESCQPVPPEPSATRGQEEALHKMQPKVPRVQPKVPAKQVNDDSSSAWESASDSSSSTKGTKGDYMFDFQDLEGMPTEEASASPPAYQLWQVVGGVGYGGIRVREGESLSSPFLAERLSTGSIIREVQLLGDRLVYRLVEGEGPSKGCVTVRMPPKDAEDPGKELCIRIEAPKRKQPPRLEESSEVRKTLGLPKRPKFAKLLEEPKEASKLLHAGEKAAQHQDRPKPQQREPKEKAKRMEPEVEPDASASSSKDRGDPPAADARDDPQKAAEEFKRYQELCARSEYRSTLHDALSRRDQRVTLNLLLKKAPVDMADNSDRTGLLRAVRWKSEQLCKLLLTYGANPNWPPHAPAAEEAALLRKDCRSSPVPALFEHGRARRLRREALFEAAAACNPEVITALAANASFTERGRREVEEDLSTWDENGYTPLHNAIIHDSRQEHQRTIIALLREKARVDAVDRLGETPLMLAVRRASDTTSCYHLLKARADMWFRNPIGMTVLDVARTEDVCDDVRQLLLDRAKDEWWAEAELHTLCREPPEQDAELDADDRLPRLHLPRPPFSEKLPKVSVLCPTVPSRSHFHPQVWSCFTRQTYPHKELVVVESGPEESSFFHTGPPAKDPRLVYKFRKDTDQYDPKRPEVGHGSLSVGSKRNIGMRHATGTVIAHFDDDDFYGPGYIEQMVSIMLRHGAHVVKLSSFFVFDCQSGRLGYCDPECDQKHKDDTNMDEFILGYGFSYVYQKAPAEREKFPNLHFGEDYAFLKSLAKSGYSVCLWPDLDGICLHMQHGRNTSNAFCSDHVHRRQLSAMDVAACELLEGVLDEHPESPSHDEYGKPIESVVPCSTRSDRRKSAMLGLAVQVLDCRRRLGPAGVPLSGVGPGILETRAVLDRALNDVSPAMQMHRERKVELVDERGTSSFNVLVHWNSTIGDVRRAAEERLDLQAFRTFHLRDAENYLEDSQLLLGRRCLRYKLD